MALVVQKLLTRCCRPCTIVTRLFHDEFSTPDPSSAKKHLNKQQEQHIPSAASIANKYQIFRDVDASVILDVEEERQLQRQQVQDETRIADIDETDSSKPLPSIFNGINLQRGKTGVYEIDDLVTVLRLNNAENIFVCSVPKEMKYVDFICVVTGMSFRHMRGISEFVRKVYKMKRHQSDVIPRIEGENSREWMALDLGNIALHVFSETAREQYDLESLWAIGAKYDKECNKPNEPLVELFERHSVYLNDLKPLRTNHPNENTLA